MRTRGQIPGTWDLVVPEPTSTNATSTRSALEIVWNGMQQNGLNDLGFISNRRGLGKTARES
jgi:hypothetical protein